MSRRTRNEVESQFDISLLLITICMVFFGLLMIYSTSSYTSQIKSGDSMQFLKKQAVGVLVGIVAMFFASKIPVKFFLKKLPVIRIRVLTIIYFLALALQVAVLVGDKSVNGAKRWLYFGPISIQPSEVSKVAVILMVAYIIYKNPIAISDWRGLLRVGVPCGILLLTIALENLSTGIIICVIIFGMMVIAAKRKKMYLVLIVLGIIGIVCLLMFGGGFRARRFDAWLNVETHESAYQTLQGLYAIASGGLQGAGLGESMQKLGFIPESHNDMIFAIICEELGIIGATVVIVMFVMMIWRIYRIAIEAPDLFSCMVCTGVLLQIAAQVAINIGVVTNTIPSTGIPLPFISYGGTSISILLAEIGVVLGVSARRKVPERKM